MAEASATATKIMGCQILYAGPVGTPFDRIPDYIGCHASILPRSILQNPSEHFSFAHVRMTEPNIHKSLAPSWDWHCSYVSALAHHIDKDPVALPQLQLIQSQTHDFRPSQSTSEQQSEHCSVSSTLQSVLRNSVQHLLCLIASQPIADFSPKSLDSLNSSDSSHRLRAQPAALSSFIGQPPDRGEMQIDRCG
jgi:hypothetical protein